MTLFEWATMLYILIVMVTLAICFHVRREIGRLRAENRMLRVRYALLEGVFRSVATDWMELLHNKERFGIHGRPVAPEEDDADSSAKQE